MFGKTFINEIMDIYNYDDDYNYMDILEVISDLIVGIKSNKNFADELSEELGKRRLEIGLCPNCGSQLLEKQYKEYHDELSEYGHIPYEIINYYCCADCGWSNN